MGLRQRNSFDGVNPAREDLNLTKYDEKFVYPTEPASGDGYRAAQPTAPLFSAVGGMQSPVQTPAPDPTEHSYVFGRQEPVDARSSVFGGDQQSYAPQQSYAAPQSYTAPSYTAQQSYAVPQSVAPAKPAYAPVSTVQSERPMVFMLRDDPNMFVYEYSDRLEYFRRTDVGMVHCATKYKAKKY